MTFALAHFWILLLILAGLFLLGIVMMIIGRAMTHRAEWQMREYQHAELIDAIEGITNESHRYH